MLELLKLLLPIGISFFIFLHYYKYKQLDHIEILLDKIDKSVNQDSLISTKECLEIKKLKILKTIITGYNEKEIQDKFLLAYAKCGEHIPDLMIRLFMPYTKLSEDQQLSFNLYPFYRQTKIADLIAIPVMFFGTCMYFFLYFKFPSIIFLIESLVMFVSFIFSSWVCFYYYKRINKYKDKYEALIMS